MRIGFVSVVSEDPAVTNVPDRIQVFLVLSMMAVGMALTIVAVFQTVVGRL